MNPVNGAMVVSPEPTRSCTRLSSPPSLVSGASASAKSSDSPLSKLCIICNNVTKQKVRGKVSNL